MMIVEQPQPLGSAISQTPILSRIHSVTDGMPQTNRRTSSSMMIGKSWFMAAFLLNSNCIHYTKIGSLWQSLFDCVFNQLDLIVGQVEVFVKVVISPFGFIALQTSARIDSVIEPNNLYRSDVHVAQ